MTKKQMLADARYLCVAGVQVEVVAWLNFGRTRCEDKNRSSYVLCRATSSSDQSRKASRTVFEDESHGGDGLSADEHDGVVPGSLGEVLGLTVGVEDEVATLIQQLLVVQRDAGPAAQQLLKQRHSVDTRGTAADRHVDWDDGAEQNLKHGLRVVLVDVDMVQCSLLQAEDVNDSPVQDVVRFSKELIEAPTLLLVGLQDVGQDRSQEALQTPETSRDTMTRLYQVTGSGCAPSTHRCYASSFQMFINGVFVVSDCKQERPDVYTRRVCRF